MVEQAELKLSYTKIVAPAPGIVMKRSAEVGERINAGQQLLMIAQIGDIWVTANFKETQMHNIHPGQSARIHVDALRQDFEGYVETIGGSTGADRQRPAARKRHRQLRESGPAHPRPPALQAQSERARSPAPRHVGGTRRPHRQIKWDPAQNASRLEAVAQPLGCCADGHHGDVHGSARLFHRQRLAPAYRRLARRHLRRSHLGPHQLSGLGRHRASRLRLALHRLRTQTLLHDLRGALHRVVVPVRHRAQSAVPHHRAHLARRGRRRTAAFRTSHPGRHVSHRKARPGVRGLWHGRGGRARHRSHARRLDYRQLQLALDLLHQPAGRPALAVFHQPPGGRSALAQGRKARAASRSITSDSACLSWAWPASSSCSTKARKPTGSPRR